jgi:dipeptidase
MCDTLVALPPITGTGNLVFAKNSDREPDEAQAVEFVPAMRHEETSVQCTFISVPQVEHTYACLLCRPFQMWGAEMGVNEHGVVIGNEAVFTRIPFDRKNNGLTGMDMLRLALERSRTASEAAMHIIRFVETYGQDACGGYRNKKFYYHNSFLIADATNAFVLETAGNHWAMEEVTSFRTISNRLSIGPDALRISDHARLTARQKRWWDGHETFAFNRVFTHRLMTWFARASERQACTTAFVRQRKHSLAVTDCIRLLQTHHVPDDKFRPSRATTASVCMHATGLLNPNETTNSMVAEIRSSRFHTVWITGTSNPCLSVFIPFFIPGTYYHTVLSPSAMPDLSLWWKAEKMHRWVEKSYQKRRASIESGRLRLQQQFIEEEARMVASSVTPYERESFTARCVEQVIQWLDGVTEAYGIN